jgi:hypothetical protein
MHNLQPFLIESAVLITLSVVYTLVFLISIGMAAQMKSINAVTPTAAVGAAPPSPQVGGGGAASASVAIQFSKWGRLLGLLQSIVSIPLAVDVHGTRVPRLISVFHQPNRLFFVSGTLGVLNCAARLSLAVCGASIFLSISVVWAYDHSLLH